jgi:hypothetical protein
MLLVALALSCGLIIAPVKGGAAGTQQGYRLAGVVAVGTDYMGFLELPQGGQVLVREGSPVNGGRVVVFTDKILRIRFPTGDIELQLEGSGRPPPPDTRDVVTQSEEISGGAASFRTVDVGSLKKSLQSGPPGTSGTSGAKKAAGGSSVPSDTQTAIAQRFEPLFQLPRGARVVAVNEAPVKSVDGAIKTVESSLEHNSVARLTIVTSDGESRVYLRPQPRPQGP